MKQFKPRSLTGMLGVLLLAAAGAGGAWAQSTTPTDTGHAAGSMGAMRANDDSSRMQGMHRNMMGMHAMPATVTSVDSKTGLVDADAEGMALKVHFPPPAVANLKTGDKITLHLSYSKP